MPSTTAGGLPYPLPTEPVRDGANAVKALADALQVRTLGLMFQVGQAIVTCNGAGGWSIVFPQPFKTGAAPLMLAIDGGASGTSIRILGVMTPVSATSVSGVAREYNGVAASNAVIRITYLAIGTAP